MSDRALDILKVDSEYCPEAIEAWASVGNRGSKVSDMTLKARKHLSALGWTLWYGQKGTRRELRYTSPTGKRYYSLKTACQACIRGRGGKSELLVPQESPRTYDSTGVSATATAVSGDCITSDSLAPVSSNVGKDSTGGDQEDGTRFDLRGASRIATAVSGDCIISGLRAPVTFNLGKESTAGDGEDRTRFYPHGVSQIATVVSADWSGSHAPLLSNLRKESSGGDQDGTRNNSKRRKREEGKSAGGISELQTAIRCGVGKPTIRVLKQRHSIEKAKTSSRKRKRTAEDCCLSDEDCNMTLVEPGTGVTSKKLKRAGYKNLRSKSVGRATTPVRLASSASSVPRGVLSFLIDNNVVHVGARVRCEGIDSEGFVTHEGIQCACCARLFTMVGFEIHSCGAQDASAPAGAHIFLDDGRSLLYCQRQLMGYRNSRSEIAKRSNRKTMGGSSSDKPPSQIESDDICSVCQHGGELVLCDDCPSAFHKSCLGLSDVPADEFWFCPQCRCGTCFQGGFKGRDSRVCYQCQHKFHSDCVKSDSKSTVQDFEGLWLCSMKCEQVFSSLQSLIGRKVPVGDGSLTWTLLQRPVSHNFKHSLDPDSIESKLHLALDVMHECFEPFKDPFTGRDLVEDVIFSRTSHLRRLNFQGFFTAALEDNTEVISVATVRVFRDLAEIPLVATLSKFRKMGMARTLMNELEKQLVQVGVERLVLPAVAGLLGTWTGHFGFSRMSGWERLKLLDHNFLDFQDTVMCHKVLIEGPSSGKSSVTEETGT